MGSISSCGHWTAKGLSRFGLNPTRRPGLLFASGKHLSSKKRLTCPVAFKFAGDVTVKLNGKGGGGGAIFEGDGGQLMIDRAQYDLRRKGAQPELTRPGPDTTMQHIANWCECIRTREKPCADIEIGHRAAVFCHLGNIARWTNRKLTWDPDKEEFVGDEETNAYLERAARAPWQLPA